MSWRVRVRGEGEDLIEARLRLRLRALRRGWGRVRLQKVTTEFE